MRIGGQIHASGSTATTERPKPSGADHWSLPLHAIAALTGYAIAIMSGRAWPAALGLGLSFSALVANAARRWTPSGRLGLANLITLIRLGLLLVAALLLPRLSAGELVVLLAAAFALDAVDGPAARRYGTVSVFGAVLDNETDATLVLVLGLVLWLRHGVGAWVLLPGSLRYIYVLTLALLPPHHSGAWRSRFGRLAFLSSNLLLLVALVVPGSAVTLCAALASVTIGVSFGRSFLVAYPGALSAWRLAWPTLLFLLAWSFLNLMANLRYPASEPEGWYFLPSLDVTVILAALAFLGLLGWRLPGWARIPLVAGFLLMRALRIGDGVTGYYFGKSCNVYTDLPLTPDLVRYAHSTFAAWKFYTGAAVALLGLVALVVTIDRALWFLADFFRQRRRVLLFACLVLPFAATSFFLRQDPRYNERYAGAFGASIIPRFTRETLFLLNVYDHRQSGMRAIGEMQDALSRTPAGLERLHHTSVYIIFIESYGVTVLDQPAYAQAAVPALKQVEVDLAEHGFTSASGRMVSAISGGMSWLAHATLLTGVRTSDQMQYELLGVAHPRSLAGILHNAGYHTILVQPNTNRRSHTADFYDFDETVKNWDFDYAGPAFAWASMPDQYVLDYVRRQIIAKRAGPLFLMYNLVSSHAPWSHVPTLVEDWSQVGNGRIYNNHPIKRAYTNWPGFKDAGKPYLQSILYDWQVLGQYLTEFVHDDSLFVILGDHQPVAEVTDNSSSFAVPVHVLSRDPALVARFRERGYTVGMVPSREVAPMDAFLVEFLLAFAAGAT